VLLSVHLVELVKMILQLFLDIENVTSECAGLVNTFPVLNLEVLIFPISNNFTFKCFLKLELLVSRIGNFLNFLSKLEERAFEELLKSECFTLVRNFFF
jgi:hypothetical protein